MKDCAMSQINHRTVQTNGIIMHIAEKGAGPLVILCHGFPEAWYSWRHQIEALSVAGFHVVAPDMRGYGRTDSPDAIDQFTLLHLVGDIIGLMDAPQPHASINNDATNGRCDLLPALLSAAGGR
jgi:pimeloyl-ACP methyl ester carboxylesterase